MPLTPDELEPLLRLALVQGIGPQRLSMLVGTFGDARGVFRASEAKLGTIPGIGSELMGRIRAADLPKARSETRKALTQLERRGAFAITPDDPAYPKAFRTVTEPPYLVFGVGDLGALERPGLAVVGTRSPTRYGRIAAERLSFDLAMAGLVVVSGLARGIDSAAHRGALDAQGTTIAVLGHGIDLIYPSENRELFARIRDRGLLLTEYPPGETPKAGNFPRRNRLIAALAEAVLVVEMGHKSGAQHTVGFALEQGREVLAVPGPILSPTSAGTNQLIKDGARLIASAEDVLEELRGVGWSALRSRSPPPAAHRLDPALPLLSHTEGALLEILSTDPLHVDDLARDTGISAADALTTLLHLELQGLVTSLPGKHYCRT
ncbi:MAG: DNA-protecting protein DprA [Gemmatimonas sp.]|nr:DNA-protecting protein DprA [Gemmatimonas sp.]